MRLDPIAHNRPTLGREEEAAAARALASGWVAQGPEVEAFENEVCDHLGLPAGHAVAVSSGTAALFLALRVLGAKGKDVACPVFACSALTNAIRLAGAEPRFIDVAVGSPNIDMPAVERSDAPIAIVAHMFGLPADIGVPGGKTVIEDCAQALGATVRDRPVGLGGRVAIFSFYASKLVTSGGQGGMLASADADVVAAARDFREFDCRPDRKPRFNIQMTDLQAAVGREQLRKLPSFVARRAEIFDLYRQAGFDLLDGAGDGAPVRYRTVLRTRNPRALIEALAARGIKAIVPIEDWELLAEPDVFPHAAAFARATVSLPTYPSLRDEDVSRVIAAVRAAS